MRVVASVGEGGKTKSVCDGVASGAHGRVFGGVDLSDRRRCAGGVFGLRDSVRGRDWLVDELTALYLCLTEQAMSVQFADGTQRSDEPASMTH